jgi:hypothetical protein
MNEPVELKISEAVIRPIIEAKMNAAVVEIMGGHERMITDMIRVWMNQKVDREGKPSSYNLNSDKTRLDYIASVMLTESLQKAITDYLQTKKELFVREFEKFFKSKQGSSQIVSAMQTGLCAALANEWRFKVELTPPKE